MTQDGHIPEMDRFHDVLDQPPEDRVAYIDRIYGDSPELAERMKRLLEAHERAERAGADTTVIAQATNNSTYVAILIW